MSDMVKMFDGVCFADYNITRCINVDKLREYMTVDRAYHEGVMERDIAEQIIRLDKLPMKLEKRRYL